MSLDLPGIIEESKRYGTIAYLGTTSKSGTPYISPVVVAWVGNELMSLIAVSEAKVANVRANGKLTVHWPVSAETNFDSLILWGSARVIDDTPGRTALWDKMGYDLNAFEPGGPSSEHHGFLALAPTKAVVLRMYGVQGRETWKA